MPAVLSSISRRRPLHLPSCAFARSSRDVLGAAPCAHRSGGMLGSVHEQFIQLQGDRSTRRRAVQKEELGGRPNHRYR